MVISRNEDVVNWIPLIFHCCTGEVKEIKQDISSLHHELAERGSSDMEKLANLIRQLDGVLQKKGKEELP